MNKKLFSRFRSCISDMNLGKKVFYSTLSVTVLPIILVFLISAVIVGSLVVKNITDTNETFLKGYSLLLGEQLEEIEELSQSILYEDVMTNLINGQATGKDEICKILNSYMYRMSTLESVMFADKNGNIYYAEERALGRSLVYKDVIKSMETKGGLPFFYTEDSVYSKRIYMARNVYSTSGKKSGVIMFMINTKFFSDIDKNLYIPYEHNIMIAENDGFVYTDLSTNSLKSTLARQTGHDFKNSYFTISVPNRSWKVVSVVPKRIMYMTVIKWYIISLLLAITVIFILYIATSKIVGVILSPMNRIISVINRNRNGEKTYFVYEYNDEYGQMASNFNDMIDELEKNRKNQVELVTLMKNAQIKELQAQITPHFLFNCLDIINWAAIKNNNMDISKMVISLSHILTVNIGKINSLVRLSQELEYFEDYVNILHRRFGNTIHITFNCDDEAYECLIIPLLLQTMVENSWVHGLRHDAGLNIDVSIVKLDNELIINVFDDGKGMSEDKLGELRLKLDDKKPSKHYSGIINLNRRIKLLYGEKYGIEVSSEENQYTSIEVNLPAKDSYDDK